MIIGNQVREGVREDVEDAMVLREHFKIKETSVWITADEKKHIEVAKDELVRQRRELERFIRWHPFFMLTLERYEFTEKEWEEMPEVARRMVKARLKYSTSGQWLLSQERLRSLQLSG